MRMLAAVRLAHSMTAVADSELPSSLMDRETLPPL